MPLTQNTTSECKCGSAVFDVILAYNRVSGSRYSDKLLERELETLSNKVKDMGDICKINIGEITRWIQLFRGNIDVIGYREKPREGLNYYEIDLDDFVQAIRNTIEDSIKKCEPAKGQIKQMKK